MTTIAYAATVSGVLCRSSETNQGAREDSLAIAREAAQVHQPITRGTQRAAMPPPREFRGPWHIVREKWPGDTAQEAVNRPPLGRGTYGGEEFAEENPRGIHSRKV